MNKRWIIYILFLSLLACKPVKKELDYAASYTSIEKEAGSARLTKMIAPYKAKVDSAMDQVIGYSEVVMSKSKDQPESLLGNFVADLVLEFSKTIDAQTDFSILNNGGLRASLPEGNLTLRNVFELMPFDNEIVIVTLDGNSVNKLFSYVAERGGVPMAGVNVKLQKMNGTIVYNSIQINGVKFSTNQSYKIATSDYLSNGGDSMGFWSGGIIQTTGKKIRDAIIDFIRLKTAQNIKLKPVLDGRISFVN